MSRRQHEPHRADLEGALRAALHVAADSVQPAPDGLERIRAKISARRPPRQAACWALLSALASRAAWLRPGPAGSWLRHLGRLGRLVVERFRPDSARAGRLGWLRPAAAVATGVFVVAAASWMITGFPQVIRPVTNVTGLGGGQAGRHVSGPADPARSRPRPGGAGPGPTYYGRHSPSPSCARGQGPQGASPTASSTGTPSESVSQSPTASPSSPSPTSSPTATLSPSASPTKAQLVGSAAGIVAALPASPVPRAESPAPTRQGTAPAPSPETSSPVSPAAPSTRASASGSPRPCVSG